MVEIQPAPPTAILPLAPANPLPYRQKLRSLRDFAAGQQRLHDAGGPVTRAVLGPRWLIPPLVLVASPQGARDLLSRRDGIVDRGGVTTMVQMQRLMGGNLLDLPHDRWLPRRRTLQPMFTKQHVPRYAGHMSAAAQSLTDGWMDGQTVDLDNACRVLTLRALGRSVLGLDLDVRAEEVGPALRTALSWVADRAVRPVNLPQWFPTRGQRRARTANTQLHRLAAEILSEARRDPDRDAPLVRALMEARDPDTGRQLTEDEICHELVLFMLAGHDTTSTTLCYSLWTLGRHPEVQGRVFSEVAALGERMLTPEAVSYTHL
ncbi:cytochrome P450, partial [Mycolicibacterium fortuitum]|uniref:cytochrome P450 n=1 Tax=Mycolicibacterium fortuitum TaxID=1766 RepID=UPI0007EB3305